MIAEILEFIVVGLVLGGIYALFAVGLTLIFGVLDVINVAHGEFFTLGGYAAFMAVVLLKLPPVLGLPLAVLAAGAVGLLVYPVLIGPLQRRLGKRPPGPLFLVLTLGLSAVMQNSMLAVAGGEYLRVPPLLRGGVDLGFTYVSNQRVIILTVACAALAALFLFLRYHRQGAAIRAVTQNPASAQAVGIPLTRIFTLTVGLGCGLAGLGGALIAPLFNVYPAVGFSLTLKAFAITILGGMGNVLGALIASFVISLTEALSVLVIPSEWTNAIAFGLMILVLLLRPQGLIGRRRR
ncbi:MAG: branched-chain amino acid ABC transporter permease [Acetobacteraceae bacterium]